MSAQRATTYGSAFNSATANNRQYFGTRAASRDVARRPTTAAHHSYNFAKRNVAIEEDEPTYGMPLRPSTPIRAVLGNFYGEIAGYEKKQKASFLKDIDAEDKHRLHNPPRNHTRASALAESHVIKQYTTQGFFDPKKASARGIEGVQTGTKSLFKMRKFLQVKPKTDTHNYKARQSEVVAPQ